MVSSPGGFTPAGKPEIRPAGWRDARDVLRLERKCFQQDAWPIWDVLGALTFPEIVRLKAELEEELVGFIACDQRPSRGAAWIATLGVLPAYRRRGIASRLLTACENQLATPLVKLSVRAGNRAAIQLYRRRGYRLAGAWPSYYRGGEDALIFQKTLRPSRSGARA